MGAISGFGRPPGMPIGTGSAQRRLGGQGLTSAPLAASSDRAADNTGLAIPRFEAASKRAPPPCAGCVELNVHVDDINQRDEFAFLSEGTAISRVTWTLLVTFNSDQLAVQPFVDDEYGTYTALHVNAFPLATPVKVVQEIRTKAARIGLAVGSSGAWTGNQTMAVFVDSVAVEGPFGFTKDFMRGAQGLEARTRQHEPRVVSHPQP